MSRDIEQYIQFLKNMVSFTKVFGGPFGVGELEQEIEMLEDSLTEEERELNSICGRPGEDENY